MSQPVSTPHEKHQKKKTNNRIMGAIIVVVTIIAALIILLLIHHNNTQNSTPNPTTTTVKPIQKNVTNKIEAQYPNAPTPNDETVTNNVSRNSISTSAGRTLTITNGEFKNPSQPCKAANTTDFCIAATGKTNSLNFDVYFLKDAVHSRLFENSENFTQVTIPGARAAGAMNMQLTEGDKVQALAVANEDSSGWLFIIKNNKNDNLNELTQNLHVQ